MEIDLFKYLKFLFILVALQSCNPVIEAKVEEVIEEGIELRLHSLEQQKDIRVGKSF
jgi:hypothetical protein